MFLQIYQIIVQTFQKNQELYLHRQSEIGVNIELYYYFAVWSSCQCRAMSIRRHSQTSEWLFT